MIEQTSSFSHLYKKEQKTKQLFQDNVKVQGDPLVLPPFDLETDRLEKMLSGIQIQVSVNKKIASEDFSCNFMDTNLTSL